MKKRNALVFTLRDFSALCFKLFGDDAWIDYEDNCWFWNMDEISDIDEDAILNKLEEELIKGLGGALDEIYIDTRSDTVIVTYDAGKEV